MEENRRMLTITKEYMTYYTAVWLINNNRDIAGMCRVVFDDGEVVLPVRAVICQLPYWEIYKKMELPIQTKHVFFTGPVYDEKLYNKILTRIYHECFNPDAGDEYFSHLKKAMWDTINNIDDFGTHELHEYICGLSIIDLAKIHQNPKIQQIVNVDIDEKLGPIRIKKNWLQGQEDLYTALRQEDFIEDNALYPFTSVNSLKKSQVFATLGHYGLRTEINDRVFPRPVYGNAIDGLNDFTDMVLENSASRKNVYYSKDAIRVSQYFNRETNLLCGKIANLYKGYCGNNVTVRVFVNPKYPDCYIGKFFMLPGDPTLRVLTHDNIDEYIGKHIDMYSILTCGYTDGVCERCMGLISRNYTAGVNVGMTASSYAISEIGQKILSIKHDDVAIPVMYTIPQHADEWFMMSDTGIRFKPEISKQFPNLELGIFYSDVRCSKGDLEHIKSDLNVPESKYSEIKTLLLRNRDSEEMIELVMVNEDIAPFLTTEFLIYAKDNMYDSIITTTASKQDAGAVVDSHGICRKDVDVFWVSLANMSRKVIPVMRSVITNDSMMSYVKHLTNMFRRNYLVKYKSASKAIQDFGDEIFRKVDNMNMYQLEIMLRGHMITNPTNYSIPVVKDPENVMFQKTKHVLANRTISSQMAHEGHKVQFANPFEFVTLKDQSMMDTFVGV